MTPKTGPNVEKNFVDVIFSSKSTYEPIFTKIGVVDRNWPTKGFSHFLVPALLIFFFYIVAINQFLRNSSKILQKSS